jgi:hypothetical protein
MMQIFNQLREDMGCGAFPALPTPQPLSDIMILHLSGRPFQQQDNALKYVDALYIARTYLNEYTHLLGTHLSNATPITSIHPSSMVQTLLQSKRSTSNRDKQEETTGTNSSATRCVICRTRICHQGTSPRFWDRYLVAVFYTIERCSTVSPPGMQAPIAG